MRNRIIVSESVTGGHPDKIADRIADSILGIIYPQDFNTRAGIEVMVKDNIVVLGGEISTSVQYPEYEKAVREVYKSLDFPEGHGLSPENIKVINLIGLQSSEIGDGVDKEDGTIGAGDQGFVCGFATNETPSYLGLGQYVAKSICGFIEKTDGLGPDGKSQVVVGYDEKGNKSIKSILVSSMHNGKFDDIGHMRDTVVAAILSNGIGVDGDIFREYIEKPYYSGSLEITVNPCGEWHTGGPVADCGVTGRKIVVDQFGGYCSVGGGNLTGKDMSKVDRSGAYMARYIAKNIVAAGVADSAKVELSYMIGVPEPSSVDICLERCTAEKEAEVKRIVEENVDLTPLGIIRRFGYIPYSVIAEFGHYGVVQPGIDYPWERTDISYLFKNV